MTDDRSADDAPRPDLAEIRRELRRELRRLDQPARDRKLRKGIAKPRTVREWEIFAADILPKRETPEDDV